MCVDGPPLRGLACASVDSARSDYALPYLCIGVKLRAASVLPAASSHLSFIPEIYLSNYLLKRRPPLYGFWFRRKLTFMHF